MTVVRLRAAVLMEAGHKVWESLPSKSRSAKFCGRDFALSGSAKPTRCHPDLGVNVYGKDSPRLTAYLWLVTAVALPVIYVVGREAAVVAASGLGSRGITIVLTLSLILIAGELWPIPVARGEEAGDEITVSSTFGFALLLLAPGLYVGVAQTVALVVDGIVRHRRLKRLPLHVAQYALAFIAARIVYAMLTWP